MKSIGDELQLSEDHSTNPAGSPVCTSSPYPFRDGIDTALYAFALAYLTHPDLTVCRPASL